MEVTDFWKELNKDIEQIRFENISEVIVKYVISRGNSEWCDEFDRVYGVHKTLCIKALCKELEAKCFFASLLGKSQNYTENGQNVIEDIKATMMAMSALERVEMY